MPKIIQINTLQFNTTISLNGSSSTFKFRFRSQADGANDAWFFDDVSIISNWLFQDLSLSSNTLSLTYDPTSVDLSPYLDNTDNQDLTLSGNTLNLSGDPTGGVDLSYLNLWERNATTNKLFPKNIGDNVGIGTNDPLDKLHIQGSSFNNSSLRFLNEANGNNDYWKIGVRDFGSNEYFSIERNNASGSGTTPFVVNSNSNVGIGITDPSRRLTITGRQTEDEAIRITHTHHSIADNNSHGLDDLGYLIQSIDFQYLPTSYSSVENTFAKIATKNYNTTGTGWYGTIDRIDAGLSFFTSENGLLNERVTIQDDGFVGVGTTVPKTMHFLHLLRSWKYNINGHK